MSEERALAIHTPAEVLEKVVVGGDLSQLSSQERLIYYRHTCESLGLNPLTRPFEYITLDKKLTLYARRDATDQLRKRHQVNVSIVARELVENVYIVTARAAMPDGRTDESIGAVPLCKEDGEWKTGSDGRRYFAKNGKVVPLGPDDRANAIMKAETKAKRRVTLSIVGLGMLDETELETISDVHPPSNGHKAEPAPRQQNGKPEPAKAGPGADNRPYQKPADPPTPALWKRWQDLWNEAQQLGIEFEGASPDISKGDLIAKGQALKAKIDAWHDKPRTRVDHEPPDQRPDTEEDGADVPGIDELEADAEQAGMGL